MTTIDRAILEELLADNINLILMALEDAAAWRTEKAAITELRILGEELGWTGHE